MNDQPSTSSLARSVLGGPIGRTQTSPPSTPTAATRPVATPSAVPDRHAAARIALRDRHSHKLARLMEDREDLRGVHALADFVHESLRWTA